MTMKVGMIQRAMKDAHISLHPTQSVKKQALDTIATLKTIMRIERMQMLVQFIYKKASRICLTGVRDTTVLTVD